MPWGVFGYFPDFIAIFCDCIAHLSLALEVRFFGINISNNYNASLAVHHGATDISNIAFDRYIFFNHTPAQD